MTGCCCLPLLGAFGVLGFAAVAGIVQFLRKWPLHNRLLRKVDASSPRCGGDLVAEVLRSHGVEFVFTLVGGHISPILVACERLGMRIIDTRHEVTTVFAADAVARISGKIAAACVTAGPGLTNTITAVKNAQMAESPLLLMGGAAAGILKNRGALQDIDQMVLLKPLCKFTATITAVRDIVPTLRRAICAAQSGTPGPVFVEFPIDTLYPYGLVQKEVGMKEAKGFIGQVSKYLVDTYLHNVFGDAFISENLSPLPPTIPLPTDAQISSAAELIRSAKRPVIVLGSQVMLPPVRADELQACLLSMAIPCFLGGMSRGLLGRQADIHLRNCRRDALKEADVVLLAGTVCDFRLSYGRVLNRRSKIICVNRSRDQLYRNSDMFWSPTLPIQADAGTTLKLIHKKLAGYVPPCDWLQLLRDKDLAKDRDNAVKAKAALAGDKLNPLKVLTSLEEIISDKTILVADGGDFVGSAAYIVRPRAPLTWLDPGAFGTLGVGAGFALGAKLCRPDHDVVVIWGDGSVGYSLAEFDTFKRHSVPVLGIVGNDACWSQIAREQVPLFGSNVACELAYCNYHLCVQGFDCCGVCLDAGDADRLAEQFRQSVATVRDGTPCLVNCLIGKTDFRQGSISV